MVDKFIDNSIYVNMDNLAKKNGLIPSKMDQLTNAVPKIPKRRENRGSVNTDVVTTSIDENAKVNVKVHEGAGDNMQEEKKKSDKEKPDLTISSSPLETKTVKEKKKRVPKEKSTMKKKNKKDEEEEEEEEHTTKKVTKNKTSKKGEKDETKEKKGKRKNKDDKEKKEEKKKNKDKEEEKPSRKRKASKEEDDTRDEKHEKKRQKKKKDDSKVVEKKEKEEEEEDIHVLVDKANDLNENNFKIPFITKDDIEKSQVLMREILKETEAFDKTYRPTIIKSNTQIDHLYVHNKEDGPSSAIGILSSSNIGFFFMPLTTTKEESRKAINELYNNKVIDKETKNSVNTTFDDALTYLVRKGYVKLEKTSDQKALEKAKVFNIVYCPQDDNVPSDQRCYYGILDGSSVICDNIINVPKEFMKPSERSKFFHFFNRRKAILACYKGLNGDPVKMKGRRKVTTKKSPTPVTPTVTTIKTPTEEEPNNNHQPDERKKEKTKSDKKRDKKHKAEDKSSTYVQSPLEEVNDMVLDKKKNKKKTKTQEEDDNNVDQMNMMITKVDHLDNHITTTTTTAIISTNDVRPKSKSLSPSNVKLDLTRLNKSGTLISNALTHDELSHILKVIKKQIRCVEEEILYLNKTYRL